MIRKWWYFIFNLPTACTPSRPLKGAESKSSNPEAFSEFDVIFTDSAISKIDTSIAALKTKDYIAQLAKKRST